MDYHMREFLVSQTKLGIVYNENFIIEPFKTISLIQSYKIYQESYDECLLNEIMTNEETLLWLEVEGLWTNKKEQEIKDSQDHMDNIKVEMFKSALDKQKVESLRKQLRGIEKSIIRASSYKSSLLQNTCEANSEYEQRTWLILQSVKVTNKDFLIEDHINTIYSVFQDNLLEDRDIRELARKEPWHSFWTVSEKGKFPLFKQYKDRELTHNQKNLLLWSQTYDNIQESLDCPDKDVIDDNDLLDGWFILQSRERQNEKKKKLLDTSIGNAKIQNSSEVFMIGQSEEHVKAIQSMNSNYNQIVLNQRLAKIANAHTSVDICDFEDKKLDAIQEAHKSQRGK